MKFDLIFLIFLILLSLIENKNIFTRSTIPITGFCQPNKGYNITIYGHISERTRGVTYWIPTFSSPSNIEATCSMSGIQDSVTNAIITCFITSKINNEDVVLIKLIADGFEDLVLDSQEQIIKNNVTCEETSNAFYLSYSSLLILIFICMIMI